MTYRCPICTDDFANRYLLECHTVDMHGRNLSDLEIESKVRLPSLLEEFDAAIRTITDERGKVYGHPKEDFERAQALINQVELCRHPGVRHVLMMICVKLSRLVQTPDHLDSLVDIVGYCRTAVMILDKEKEDSKCLK